MTEVSPQRHRRTAGLSIALGLILLAATGGVRSEDPTLPELPDPLTLSHALDQAEHGFVARERALGLSRLQAEHELRESDDDLSVLLAARARWIEPSSLARDSSNDDHKLSLIAEKPLYDFGYTQASLDQSRSQMSAARAWQKVGNAVQRLDIMAKYFEVLLADLNTVALNEVMAIDFIRFDRLRERSEMGEVSDIDVLEAEAHYLGTLREQRAAEAAQRLTRDALALAMNRPGDLPNTLVEPQNPYQGETLPDDSVVWDLALNHNGKLAAHRLDLEASMRAQASARADTGHRLVARGEWADYSREDSGADRWRLGVLLEIPLYTGGRGSALQARARSDVYQSQLALDKARADLQHRVLALWQEIGNLDLAIDSAVAAREYRDLYLDRSRALYELDVKTDLGDAMAQFSSAQYELARLRYRSLLAWEELNVLTGGQLVPQAWANQEGEAQ